MCFWNGTKHGCVDDDPFLFNDASFIIRDALQKSELKDSKLVSFSLESANYHDHFLKYFDGNLIVQELKNTEEDNAAATWFFENSLYM